MAKFALLSHILSPSPSGQAVMLYRILSGFTPSEYYLISKESYAQDEAGTESRLRLQARYYSLPREPRLNRPSRMGLGRIRRIINLFVCLIVRTKNIISIIRHEPTRAIVACSGDLVDIPAGFIASRITRLPFYAYIFDDFVYQWIGVERLFAKLISPLIFKNSSGIIGPNEFICEEYRRRYAVTPTLIRNPCDQNELKKRAYLPWPSEKNKVNIFYTGAVYHANYDCFRNLVTVVENLKGYNIKLHIFTAQTREQLESQGIKSEKVFIHSHVAYHEVIEQQRKADILFLPLAFDSPIPEVIGTSAPGKIGEYLASGRPVLVHAPKDSFVSWYFRTYNCGAVVDVNSPSALAKMIEQIIKDTSLRQSIITNACARANIDYNPQVAQLQFKELVGA